MARVRLLSAALRHVRDAEHLLEQGPHRSVEQSLHLAGFAPECAIKACIDEDLADKALAHNIADAGNAVVGWLLACDPAASRYKIDRQVATLPHRAEHWRLESRYMATETADERVAALVVVATLVVEEARAFVDGCVTQLWCDGAISGRLS